MCAVVLAFLSRRAGITSEDDVAGDDEEAEEHRQVVDREALLHEGAGLLSGVTSPTRRSSAPTSRPRTTTRPSERAPDRLQIGRAHVLTPVTNAHLVCRLLLEKKTNVKYTQKSQATHPSQ